jgi:hypothetical protein
MSKQCNDNEKHDFRANDDSIRNIVCGHERVRKGIGSLRITVAVVMMLSTHNIKIYRMVSTMLFEVFKDST